MAHIFNELDHRLSVVKRWSVVQTIRQQSVAEHSYNVAVIALRIAEQWYGINGGAALTAILKRALFHDWWESITGDAPTYMKRFIDESSAITEFEANDVSEGVDLGDVNRDVYRIIVKMADYIDALIFLRMEVSLGNKSVVNHIREMEQRFKEFLEENPIEGVKTTSAFELYQAQIVDTMFNSTGQFMSELHGFPKR